ncbi:MAG TPA: CPBP family intramembrane glutamic endopeptidase [Gemmataceae bacterium]
MSSGPRDLPGDSSPGPFQTEYAAQADRRRRRALRTAAGILIAVGIITALEYLLLLRVLPDELARGASAPADAQDQAVRDAALRAVRLIFSGFVGLGVLFVGLGLVLHRSPVIAGLTGLFLYVGSEAAVIAIAPGLLFLAWPWNLVLKFLLTAGLFRAALAAVEAEQIRRGRAEREAADAAAPPGPPEEDDIPVATPVYPPGTPPVPPENPFADLPVETPPPSRPPRSSKPGEEVGKVVVLYFALLAVVLASGWWAGASPPEDPPGVYWRDVFAGGALVLLLVGAGFLWVRRPRPLLPAAGAFRAWAEGAILFAGMLLLNVAYTRGLRDYIDLPIPDAPLPLGWRDFFLAVLAVAVLPAVAEEFFFRYLALGHLREVMSGHGAVWVSAVMFATAHVHDLGGVPVFALAGVALGYARLRSGGMLLPVLMHFGNNFTILATEGF